MIWLVMGILILGVVLYMAQPLYLKTAPKTKPDSEVGDYLSRIADIDTRLARVSADNDISELENAKVELQRQLLGKAKQGEDQGPSIILLGSLFVALMFGTLGLYSTIGRPDLSKTTAIRSAQNPVPEVENTMTLEEAVASLEAKLKQNDQDPKGWMLYARSLMSMRRFDDAVVAYEKVLKLTNNNPDVQEEFESAKAYITQVKAGSTSSGPDAEQIKQAAEMTPEQRQAMIKNMVDGLAGKLAENPNDPQSWVRLLRARKVIGDAEQAKYDIDLMTETFKSNPEIAKRILLESGWK